MADDLIQLSQAERAIQESDNLVELLNISDEASAVSVIANSRKMDGLANLAKSVALKANWKAGGVLRELKRGKGNQYTKVEGASVVPSTSPYRQAIDEAEIGTTKAKRLQTLNKIPKDDFTETINETLESGDELTEAGILRKFKPAHVGHNSGENEWYTPPKYIEAARRVMGGIDLDPASSEIANEIVGATMYYTEESDGLAWDWEGRVWMNPPYAQPLITYFCDKLATDLDMGFITEAITLTNNATETKWFQDIFTRCAAACFPVGRIRFIDIDGNPGKAPLQGQAFLYFGKNVDRFIDEFGAFGPVAKVIYANRTDER